MPRTRSLAWSQLKVGLLTVVALVLAAVFILSVGGVGFSWQQYTLRTRFTDIAGLKTGAVVRVAGVEVGTVDAIEFVGPEVEVTMRVQKDVQPLITTESRASIGALSLLGAPVVDLTPSSRGDPVPDGGMIPSRRPPGQLADVAEAATRGLEQATGLIADVRGGRGTVGRLFTDEALYREVEAFVGAAENLVAAIDRGQGTLGRLVRDPTLHDSLRDTLGEVASITGRLARGEGSLGQLLHDDGFAASLTATTRDLQAIADRLSRGEGTAGRLLTDDTLYARLTGLGERLDRLATRLEAGEGTAGQLLKDRQLYENMNAAVVELRGLVSDIRREPRKYLNMKLSLF